MCSRTGGPQIFHGCNGSSSFSRGQFVQVRDVGVVVISTGDSQVTPFRGFGGLRVWQSRRLQWAFGYVSLFFLLICSSKSNHSNEYDAMSPDAPKAKSVSQRK